MFNIKFFLLLLFVSTLYGKKDFYYNFINPDLTQISQIEKRKIVGASDKLKEIRRYIKEGQLDVALKNIIMFRNSNKIEMLDSQAVLLQSEILYKLNTVPKAVEANELLESAINNSEISQDDLLEAYRLLVLIKISLNKTEEAEYYAKAIENSFDDPLSKVYGKVALSQIHVKRRDYRKAIKILRQELINTTSLEVATIIADELYDAYILNDQKDEAYDLAQKVLNRNIDYYANDSYKALKKVDKLADADMSEFAIEILKKLIENSIQSDSIDNFRFKLADVYMKIAGFQKEYLPKAKAIYEDLIQEKKNSSYRKRAKMYLDEIIMREGKFEPAMMAAKYSDSETMQYKAMMQELLNAIEDEKFEQIIRMKKIYQGIFPSIVKRFGYESIEQIYNIVNSKMIEYYLQTNQCKQLNVVIKDISDDVLLLLIKDTKTIDKLFGCMIEIPDERSYSVAKNVYGNAKNNRIYFYLEKVALLLNKYDDAKAFSQKLDMFSDASVLSDEFLYRFLIYANEDNSQAMQNYFAYARANPEFIINNKNNPLIIDFYHQYYLYLLKEKEENEAISILKELYKKQNEMKARVYSPFVEIELAKYAKLDDNYDEALEYLQYGLNIKRLKDGKSIDRKIKGEDLAHIYYEIAKIYEFQGKQNRYKDAIKKCQRLENIDSFYKKMCDKMK
jgi:tetratricopeptide (TPR) repeat protein